MLTILLAGCAARTDLGYRPPSPAASIAAAPSIAAVHVFDERATAPRNVGAVMGFNGTPLKRLETEGDAAGVVAKAFGDALASRGELGTPDTGRYDLNVIILALDGEQWVDRQGEADFVVRLVDRVTGREAYSARVDEESRGDNYLAVDNLVLGSPTALGEVVNVLLNRAINDTLDQSGFVLALR